MRYFNKFLRQAKISSYILVCISMLIGCQKFEPERITKIQTGKVSEVTYNSASVEIIINDPGEGITEHGHCWSKTPEPRIDRDSCTKLGSRTSYGKDTSFLQGLSPNTEYFVCAYAKSKNELTYGEDTEFTTGIKPKADFTVSNREPTTDESVQFTDRSTNEPKFWNWNFGDGTIDTVQNPTHSYNKIQKYTIILTVSNEFGSDTAIKIDYINVKEKGSPPVADFNGSPRSGAVPLLVSFEDQSSGTVTSRIWDFGDGGTSTAQNPSHTYTTARLYTVKLTVSNEFGTDEEIKTNYITVGNPPEVDFYATRTELKTGEAVGFKDLSTNNPTAWTWYFGDGSTSTQQNPSHTYNKIGTFTVELTASNDYGQDTETKTDYISVQEIVTDWDGNEYKTIKIGSQTWMAENLATTKLNDGTLIELEIDDTLWQTSQPLYSWYDDNPSYRDTYGIIYNWFAVNTEKLCPTGWHVPSHNEWTTLEIEIGGRDVAGGKLKEAGFTHWMSPNTGASDEFNFTALPSGGKTVRLSISISTARLGYTGVWWSSTDSEPYAENSAIIRIMVHDSDDVEYKHAPHINGYSVRCVKD